MTLQVAWNTNRLYTEHGQRIAARLDRVNGCIYFKDIDRGIDGTIRPPEGTSHIENEHDLMRVTLHCYDYLTYLDGVMRWGSGTFGGTADEANAVSAELYQAALAAPSLKKE